MSNLQPNAIESLGLGAPIGTTQGHQSTHTAPTGGIENDHKFSAGSGVAGGGTRAGNNADVYQSGNTGQASGGLTDKLAQATGHSGAPRQDGVSGAYEGSGTSHGLTGESHAQSHHSSNLAAGAGGLGAGALGAGAVGHEYSGREGHSGLTSGNQSSGLAGGLTGGQTTGLNAGQDRHGSHGLGAGAVGAGAAGVGAGTLASGHRDDRDSHSQRREHDQPERGQPISKPEELDSGTRHGLVWQESTGKYVHRHELENEKNAARRA